MSIKSNGDSTTPVAGDVVGPASATDDTLAAYDGTTGKLLKDGLAKPIIKIGITVDGGGSALTTGLKGYSTSPVAGTIERARLFADQSGSIVFDVWKDTWANFPPTGADTITASAKPTLSSAQNNEDTTLTGWTTSVSKGDVFGFNIDSITTITRATLELWIQT